MTKITEHWIGVNNLEIYYSLQNEVGRPLRELERVKRDSCYFQLTGSRTGPRSHDQR